MHLLGYRDMDHVAIRVSCRSRMYKTKQNKTKQGTAFIISGREITLGILTAKYNLIVIIMGAAVMP